MINAKLQDMFSTRTYRAGYIKAKATHTCLRCKKPARVFRDASGRLEYAISALCQGCQDECFKGRKVYR